MSEIEKALVLVSEEYTRATAKHPPYPTAHHAYAVIAEELDEVWDIVKNRNLDSYALRNELVQVATTALRAIIDLKLPNESAADILEAFANASPSGRVGK